MHMALCTQRKKKPSGDTSNHWSLQMCACLSLYKIKYQEKQTKCVDILRRKRTFELNIIPVSGFIFPMSFDTSIGQLQIHYTSYYIGYVTTIVLPTWHLFQ